MNLKGKKVIFLGDSITQGQGVDNIEENRYDNRLKKMADLLKIYNYGIGGTRISFKNIPSEYPDHDLYFCGRARRMNPDADIVIVFGGTNDFSTGNGILGNPSDTDLESFYGALNYLMSYLKEAYNNKTVVFVTPAHREDDDFPGCMTIYNNRHSLKEYVEAIEFMGREYDIPVLNLFEKLSINPNKADDKSKYTIDGLHFNDEGHRLLSECIYEFLVNL